METTTTTRTRGAQCANEWSETEHDYRADSYKEMGQPAEITTATQKQPTRKDAHAALRRGTKIGSHRPGDRSKTQAGKATDRCTTKECGTNATSAQAGAPRRACKARNTKN